LYKTIPSFYSYNWVSKVEKASANRYPHTIKLSSAKDADKKMKWLKEAYKIKNKHYGKYYKKDNCPS
jgi:hypothetical protein